MRDGSVTEKCRCGFPGTACTSDTIKEHQSACLARYLFVGTGEWVAVYARCEKDNVYVTFSREEND